MLGRSVGAPAASWRLDAVGMIAVRLKMLKMLSNFLGVIDWFLCVVVLDSTSSNVRVVCVV